MSNIIRVYATDELLEDIERFMMGFSYHADKYQNELYYLFDLWINCELKRNQWNVIRTPHKWTFHKVPVDGLSILSDFNKQKKTYIGYMLYDGNYDVHPSLGVRYGRI